MIILPDRYNHAIYRFDWCWGDEAFCLIINYRRPYSASRCST